MPNNRILRNGLIYTKKMIYKKIFLKVLVLSLLVTCFYLFYLPSLTFNIKAFIGQEIRRTNLLFTNDSMSCIRKGIHQSHSQFLIDGEFYPKTFSAFNNLSIDYNCLAKSRQIKIILLWNSFFALKFNKEICPIKTCLFTYDREFQDHADLVIVHMSNIIDELPKNRVRPHYQRWVFGLYESQQNTDDYSRYDGFFNLSATFLRHSEFNEYYLHPSEPYKVKSNNSYSIQSGIFPRIFNFYFW